MLHLMRHGPQESCFFHSSPFFAMSFRSTGCFSGTLLQHILSLEGRCSSHSDSRGGGLAHTWASDPKRWLSIHSRLICWGSNHYQHLILTLKIGGIKRWMIRIIFFVFFGCCLIQWWNTWMTEPKQNGNTWLSEMLLDKRQGDAEAKASQSARRNGSCDIMWQS